MKRTKRKNTSRKNSHPNSRLGCILTIIVLIPVIYGIYLYCQQFDVAQQESKQQTAVTSPQIPVRTQGISYPWAITHPHR